MDFAFTEEQHMIRDTAAAFLEKVSTSVAVRKAMATESGYEEHVWQAICNDMVWPALHIPEQYGGMGLGYVELAATLEQMGRSMLCSPFFSTVCLGANALMLAANEKQKAHYLPLIAQGSLTATLAYTGLNRRWDAAAVECTAQRVEDGYVLDGTYRYVPDGHSAGLIVVAARRPGSVGTRGVSLFVLDANSAGLAREYLPTMDQTRKQAQLVLRNVRVDCNALLGKEGEAWPKLAQVIQLAQIALAAEQMGGAQQILDMTVAYSKERVQFDRSIASFQAVKHKAADMMLRSEVARSAVYYAACVADEALQQSPLAGELAEAASVAKAWCSDAYLKNAGEGLQLHGGVGFTWEYDVHLHLKRARSMAGFLGSASWHREQVAALLLDDDSMGRAAGEAGI
jgi:alkylation response protein AidB-like acyl-CoA dehydrogenase